MSKFSQYMSDAEREYDDLEESNDKLQNRVKELEEEIEEEKELGYYIDIGNWPKEYLHYKCSNMQILQLMEQLEETIKTTSPNEIINRLKG